jgi:hypothetical protein
MRPRADYIRPYGESNKKSLRHISVTEAVKKQIIAVPLRFIALSGQKTGPMPFNGGIPQSDTCCAHEKTNFPASCSSGAFRRAQASELSAFVHLSGAQGFSVTSPGHRIYNYKTEFNIA